MLKYYVTHEGKQFGPWSVEEIRTSLEKKNLSWADYLYDDSKKDWILLAEHPYFNTYFQKMNPVQPYEPKNPALISEIRELDFDKQWFVLKGENKYGPFAFLELVRMLQEKNLYEYDYVWTKAMTAWSRIADCEDFTPTKIKQLKESKQANLEEVFFRRRHARTQYGASVLIHNNKKVWKGRSVELSPGGAGLFVDTKDLEPGQTLFLHFKVGDDVPPFNAICSIVSKQYVAEEKTEVKYGVKFTNINKDIQLVIKTMTEKVAA